LGRVGVADVYGTDFRTECADSGAAYECDAAFERGGEAVVERPGSAGRVLFAAAGYGHGDAPGAGATDRFGASGKVGFGGAFRGECRDIFGGDGAAVAGCCTTSIGIYIQ